MVSYWAYSSTLKMDPTYSTQMSLDFQRTAQCYIPEDRTPRNHRCDNVKIVNSGFVETVYVYTITSVSSPDNFQWRISVLSFV
jgi:hypothetical protein